MISARIKAGGKLIANELLEVDGSTILKPKFKSSAITGTLVDEDSTLNKVRITKDGFICNEYLEAYTFTNLIQDGEFTDISKWSNQYNSVLSIDTTEHYSGSTSMKVKASDITAPETYWINNGYTIPYILGHIYYCSVMVKQDTDLASTAQIYFPYASPYPQTSMQVSKTWQRMSYIIPEDTKVPSGSYHIRYDNDINKRDITVWYDCAMLIDLTEACGAGNEPSKDWCDKNISFFEDVLEVSAL